MTHAEVRALVRRVTMKWKSGLVISLDTLAHENREVQAGPAFASPTARFTQDGVAFCQRGPERPEITVEEIPEDQDHNAFRVRPIEGGDGAQFWIS